MRKIKFRIWDNLTNEMYYDALVGNCRGESTVPCVYLNDVGWAHTDNCVVEQFTGLYDKNGKEIYEGDIVEYFADVFSEIKFIAGGFHIVSEKFGWDFMGQAIATIEVVGSIHDNKVLLND